VVAVRNAEPAPFTYTLSDIQEFRPESVFAHWDGSGASGDFLACLTFVSDSGNTFSRTFPTTPIKAGGEADVSYAPFPGGIAAPPNSAGLPFWTDILSGLTLNYDSIEITSSYAFAMQQDIATDASVFYFLRIQLLGPPTPSAVPYAIVGLPELPVGVTNRPYAVVLNGVSFRTVGTTWDTSVPSFVNADGQIVPALDTSPVVCGNNYSAGDLLFVGGGVFPVGP
jgi:hypothetical protein